MDTDIIKTDVDNFIKLVKEKGRITISESAKLLNINEKTVQAWTDFLVEEKVLGTEYKFTTQYVFYNLEKELDHETKEDKDSFIKEKFFHKARLKKISESNIKVLWNKYLNENKYLLKEMFIKKCKKKFVTYERSQELWERYYETLKEE
jgi:phage antirepressor YoqD-like protein